MNTRLRKELHDFLIQYDISLESKIVNHFLYQMAGVNPKRNEEGQIINEDFYGLQLEESRFSNEVQDLLLRIPDIKIPDLLKLLEFLKIKFNTFYTSSSVHLTLDKKFVDEFFPRFKLYFETQLQTSPEIIAEYRVKSKPILEKTAEKTMRKYTNEAIETLLTEKADSLDKTTIRKFLQAFGDSLERLDKHRDIYTEILESADTLVLLMDCEYVANNKKLENQLKSILDGIDLYKRYHRNDSVFAIEAFNEEMEKYLNEELQISHACTDIVEDTLLALADVKLGPNGKTKIEVGEDKARYIFKFEDISQEETKKLISYLRQLGDETVTEGYGYSSYGSALPSHNECNASIMKNSPVKLEKKIEKHSIEVDGKFLHDTLMPLLKIKLNNMQETTPDSLAIYRGESKEYLDELAAAKAPAKTGTLTGNMNALFTISDRAIETSESEAIEIPNTMKIP